MKIILIRHSQTASTLLKKYMGASDEPLCEEGILNANNAKLYPDVCKVYTSGMKRTNETAKIMFPNAEVIEKPELREMDFGNFEGKSHDELSDNEEYRNWLESFCEDACPNGEKKEEFTKRCVSGFINIANEEFESGAEELYFVVHGGVIMALLSELVTPKIKNYFETRVECCESIELETYEESLCFERPFKMINN